MSPPAPTLEERRAAVERDCTECGVCVKECGFLQLYGTPKALAAGFDPADPKELALPFECSLCSLCTAVCPFGVDPKALFLDLRREAVRRGAAPMPEHKGLLGYEKAGTSKRFTWYGLPAGCDTVFFPGCALPGTRPGATFAVYDRLSREIPNLGVVLDCCTKPSHDLGRQEHFSALFGELREWLVGHGVQRVLVACPNCWKVFTEYAPDLKVETVYEVLDGLGARPDSPAGGAAVTVHDPCVMRFAPGPQEAVRSLAGAAGLEVEEMTWSRGRTLCCGEGGTVGVLAPSLAEDWGERRRNDAAGRPVVTYCAGCANYLSGKARVSHVLDVLADPASAVAGKAKVSRGLATYWNRLRLKARFRREVGAAVTRERTITPGGRSRGWLKPVLLLLVLAAAVAGVRASGLGAYLEQEKLRGLIAGFGPWAPALYVLLYTVAPALFLPGLPITVVGGILFGPVWGVAYTIAGATAGACVAFLVSRYVARGWVERRLVGSRWQKLDEEVAKHGWKVVAFTRLVPLFPFNLLNYALGLTKIGFVSYAVTTFFGMLPACIAFIVFSSSLLGLLRGKVSPTLLVGVLLIVAVSLLPSLVKRLSKRKALAAQAPRKPWSPGRSLRRKGLALAGAAALAAGVAGAVRHFFWALNAHLYTLEFNLLFLVGRLNDGNAALLADYLRPMSLGRFLLAEVGVNLLRAFRFPFSTLNPVAAGLAGRGLPQALLGGTVGGLAAALAAWGLGRFVLGDLLPWARKLRRLEPESAPAPWVPFALGFVTAYPFLPAAVGPALLGAARVPAGPALVALVLGALARAALLLFL